MTPKLSQVTSAMLTVCALVVTGLLVRRELVERAAGPRTETSSQLEEAHWQRVAMGGHRLGPQTATVVVVEFGDFECPACRRFNRGALRAAMANYPHDIALVFRHWPLEYHKQAYPAALAAECAGQQGRFESAFDVLYEKQDSLGSIPWREYARRSGVPDLEAFDACLGQPEANDAIQGDIELAAELRADGTPTILVNGTLLEGVPDSSTFDRLLRGAMSGSETR